MVITQDTIYPATLNRFYTYQTPSLEQACWQCLEEGGRVLEEEKTEKL